MKGIGSQKMDRNKYKELVEIFIQIYGVQSDEVFLARAPGRVNLIGEHTDYNEGFVLPIAIEKEVMMAGRARQDSTVRIFSLDYDQQDSFDLSDITYTEDVPWSNYVRGVVQLIAQRHPISGMNLILSGDVPKGAGLSSSAALEVCVATLIQAVFGFELPAIEVALLAQKAENEFVGVNCGIMDQFISRLGQKGHALLIDCRDLSYRQVRWPQDDVKLLIAHTGVQRGLAKSAYNQRRRECETAVEQLSEVIEGIHSLRDVSVEEFNKYVDRLEPTVRSRAAHVITENHRVIQAVDALNSGDWKTFGCLMIESHESLRDLYQVSCEELDHMVDIFTGLPGVYGARMTGAGFGGCAIALIKEEAQQEVQKKVAEEYLCRTGLEPLLILTSASWGASAWRAGE
jgi:galactokinase